MSTRRRVLGLALMAIGFVLAAGRQAVATKGLDPQCPPLECCEQARAGNGSGVNVGIDTASAVSCFPSSPTTLWTAAYCCPGRSSADCYRWGEEAPGRDVGSHAAASAVQCRHICQAREDCEYWTYILNQSRPRSSPGRCLVKAGPAAGAEIASSSFQIQRPARSSARVSGSRLCNSFAEGLHKAGTALRRGFDSAPWRTAASAAAVATAGFNTAWLRHAGTPQWHAEAAQAFVALGFVAVLDALGEAQAMELHETVAAVAERMLLLDPLRLGNRGPRRYSYGGASRTLHMLHLEAWSRLLDIDSLQPLLSDIFPDGYYIAGGGGDFVLGGADLYQTLHADIGGGAIYQAGPPPAVAMSFVVDDLPCEGGPVRVLPGTQYVQHPPPSLYAESRQSKEEGLLCPLPRGSVIVRDLRTWHGGTPNALNRTRYLPGIELVGHAWAARICGTGHPFDPCRPILPKAAHDQLGAVAWRASSRLVDTTGAVQEMAQNGSWLLPSFPAIWRHKAEAY